MSGTEESSSIGGGRRLTNRAVIKAAISAACLALLLNQIGAAGLTATLLQANPLTIAGLILLLCGLGVLQALRWWLIGKKLGLQWSIRVATELAFVGAFFNQLLPSSSGGDAVRVWKLKQAGIPIRRAVSSVLLDRISALVAIGLIFCFGISVLYDILGKYAGSIDAPSFYAYMGAFLILSVAIVWATARLPFVRQSRLAQIIYKLIEDAKTVFLSPTLLLATTAISLLIQIGIGYVVWSLATDFGGHLDFIEFSLLWPVVFILSFLPISIAGWGVREGAMVVAFHILGNPSSIALAASIAYGVIMIIASIPGGILWFLSSFKEQIAPIKLTEIHH